MRSSACWRAWGSWGAVPELFDEQREEWVSARAQLRGLLDDDAYAAARRTTINAHYTDPAIARRSGGWSRISASAPVACSSPAAAPACSSASRPKARELTGVELDPTTAAIAAALNPHAEIRAESFAATRLPDGYFDATVGNVPFADVRLHDPRHNSGHHSLHNHFIVKSLSLTATRRPGRGAHKPLHP